MSSLFINSPEVRKMDGLINDTLRDEIQIITAESKSLQSVFVIFRHREYVDEIHDTDVKVKEITIEVSNQELLKVGNPLLIKCFFLVNGNWYKSFQVLRETASSYTVHVEQVKEENVRQRSISADANRYKDRKRVRKKATGGAGSLYRASSSDRSGNVRRRQSNSSRSGSLYPGGTDSRHGGISYNSHRRRNS